MEHLRLAIYITKFNVFSVKLTDDTEENNKPKLPEKKNGIYIFRTISVNTFSFFT